MEEYKVIEGFENYEVLNNGIIRNKTTSKILKYALSKKGYRQVVLCKQTKGHTKLVHRLFGNAFIPNPYNKPIVDHIDNNRQNNNISNL